MEGTETGEKSGRGVSEDTEVTEVSHTSDKGKK